MANIVEQISFISLLLDALPSQAPGFDKTRLLNWLDQRPDPISYRQLQRYLEDLETVGWVKREKSGKNDLWIRVHRGTKLIDITRERAFSLQLIQQKLHHLMPPQLLQALAEEFKLAHEKLSQHCPHERQWLGKIGEAPALLMSPEFGDGVFNVLTEALLEDKWLDVDYVNKDGKGGVRRIMPLGVASKDGVYYLIGRYTTDTQNRQFRIDRIVSAVMTDDPFNYPEDFRLIDYMDEGFFNYPSGGKISLVMRIHRLSARHLQDTPLSEDQQLSRIDDDWMRLTATVQDSQRLHWWILGFGDQIVVESPVELREIIMEHVANLAKSYGTEFAL